MSISAYYFSMLQDWHIHLEHSSYTKKDLEKFINQAKKIGLEEIGIVEHSHQFLEFLPLYKETIALGGKMASWYLNKNPIPLRKYFNFVKEMKKEEWPLKVNYGLEICYLPQHEKDIFNVLKEYHFDFYIGSIHHIDNIAYDLKDISREFLWDKQDTDTIYHKYYDLVEQMVKSRLFNIIGHLDNIKIYNRYPNYDLKETYEKIAKLCREYNVIVENNSGISYRYQHKDIGVNKSLLGILKENQVRILTSSDAHYPKDVGKYITEL